MNRINAHVQLLRLNKPIGIFLLWSPIAWALWTAASGSPGWHWIVLFFLATVVMRTLGCVINDLADASFDKYVKRTAKRPLASHMMSRKVAWYWLFFLMFLGCLFLLALPLVCVFWAIVAGCLIVVYPFCKRFMPLPQLVLSIAFSMGIPMVYAALQVPMTMQTLLLIIINMCWVLAYDIIYAMMDQAGDKALGLHSGALYFGSDAPSVVWLLYLSAHLLWLLDGHTYGFYACWGLSFLLMRHQMHDVRTGAYASAFEWSGFYGVLMWFAVMLD